MRHLVLNLESPLMAFGGETIDNYGFIRRFPAASMLTGLLANALGWRRVDRERHQHLQERLVFAVRIDREPHGNAPLIDFQTAQLAADDEGWTTRGVPEERGGGPGTYDSPHLRYRHYFADMRVTVALRLEPEANAPTLDDLANALQTPARPLFIGRKPCLPSAPLLLYSDQEGGTALDALLNTPISRPAKDRESVSLLWPASDGAADPDAVSVHQRSMITDQRNWMSGLHGGGRTICEGIAGWEQFPAPVEEER